MKIFNKNKCYNGGTKHNFMPRYSERRNTNEIEYGWYITPVEFRKFIYYTVYEKDICTWCGKETKNEI